MLLYSSVHVARSQLQQSADLCYPLTDRYQRQSVPIHQSTARGPTELVAGRTYVVGSGPASGPRALNLKK